LQDWPLELRQLKDRVQSHQDAAQTEKLQAEIEELTRYLDEVFEAAVGLNTNGGPGSSAPLVAKHRGRVVNERARGAPAILPSSRLRPLPNQ
jgi:hypothetical protein